MPNKALADALRMKAESAQMAPMAQDMKEEEPEVCRCPKCGYEGPCSEFQEAVGDGT